VSESFLCHTGWWTGGREVLHNQTSTTSSPRPYRSSGRGRANTSELGLDPALRDGSRQPALPAPDFVETYRPPAQHYLIRRLYGILLLCTFAPHRPVSLSISVAGAAGNYLFCRLCLEKEVGKSSGTYLRHHGVTGSPGVQRYHPMSFLPGPVSLISWVPHLLQPAM
jgi:hypothetical protein